MINTLRVLTAVIMFSALTGTLLMTNAEIVQLDQDDSALRAHKLNFELAEALRNLYIAHVTGQNAIAIKYGAFNANSWVNAQTQQLNFANINGMIGEVAALYIDSTPDFAYIEHTPFGDIPAYGLANISSGLVWGAVVGSRVYSQYHLIGNLDIKQLTVGREATFRVGGPTEVTTLTYRGPPGTYAANATQLTPTVIEGWRYHTYQRQIVDGQVSLLIKAVDGYFQYKFINGVLTMPINTVPYTLQSFQ